MINDNGKLYYEKYLYIDDLGDCELSKYIANGWFVFFAGLTIIIIRKEIKLWLRFLIELIYVG